MSPDRPFQPLKPGDNVNMELRNQLAQRPDIDFVGTGDVLQLHRQRIHLLQQGDLLVCWQMMPFT